MVIGNGLLAKTFESYRNSEEILIFASGVSNSTEKDPLQFSREFDLLKKTIKAYPSFKLVYFSTLSIEDKSVQERPYIKHKLQLEDYIKKNANKYLIARVSNVVGEIGNTHTIINYLVKAVKNEDPIEIWQLAERNIIDKDDLKYIIDELLRRNCTNKIVNVALSQSLLVTDIVSQIELYLQKKADARFINKGNSLHINVSKIDFSIFFKDPSF
jgi:hypothetical protein